VSWALSATITGAGNQRIGLAASSILQGDAHGTLVLSLSSLPGSV